MSIEIVWVFPFKRMNFHTFVNVYERILVEAGLSFPRLDQGRCWRNGRSNVAQAFLISNKNLGCRNYLSGNLPYLGLLNNNVPYIASPLVTSPFCGSSEWRSSNFSCPLTFWNQASVQNQNSCFKNIHTHISIHRYIQYIYIYIYMYE